MRNVHSAANILLLDIETSPMLGWTWRKWQTDLLKIEQDWKLLMVGYKWLNDKGVKVLSGRLLSEGELVEEVYDLLDKADIVVAHNGDRFDVKKLQAKMAEYKWAPPSPFKTVDTMRVAKNHFAFSSNKLDDLGTTLQLGNKLDTGGFKLWMDILRGETHEQQAAWKKMERYCKQDVALLEKLYATLRPWTPRHPNMAVFNPSGKAVCSCCGSKHLDFVVNKYYTNSSAYSKYVCLDCGAWSRLRKADGVVRPSGIMADRK